MITLLSALGASLLLQGPVPEPPIQSIVSLRAVRILEASAEPSVDGQLTEDVWLTAPVAGGFTQYAPSPGSPPTQRTEARLAYSDAAIYIAMRMFDSAPDSIAAQLARRDPDQIYSDWAHVLIGSYNDNRTAFAFSASPRGVKRDVFHFDDTSQDASWDAVWEVATRTDSLGWTAEFRIPLSQLRFATAGGEQVWGMNFGREVARHQETSYWSPIEPSSGRFVSAGGELRGLVDLRTPRQLELQPYSLARYTRAPGELENPLYAANRFSASFGADVKYGITSDLTLTATVNPDFGQVEADPSQVNLSAYETFLPERRPFFVEGADIFGFEMGQVDTNDNERLFYSRRIGRAPQRDLSIDGYVEEPEATRILGAAKLSGKTRGGWSVGILNATTGAAYARAIAGVRDTLYRVEPLTNYSVARLSRDFRQGRTALGGVLTATHRRLGDDPGLDFLRRAAYVGGMDGRHRFGGDRYEMSVGLLGSYVRGSTVAITSTQRTAAHYFQRPDAEHLGVDSLATSLSGVSATAYLGKIAGGHWRWNLFGAARSPGFESNDLGFLRVADAGSVIGGVSYVQNQPGPFVRSWSTRVDTGAGWTFGGERFLQATVSESEAQFQNFWTSYLVLIRFAPAISTVALRGGPALYRPGVTAVNAGFGTDSRNPVRLQLNGEIQREDGTGSSSMALSPSLRFRPSDRATVSIEPRFSRDIAAWQYVRSETVGAETRYVGGHLRQTTASITARLDYTFTPDVSVQLYAQPFVSAGEYSRPSKVANAGASRFEERFTELVRDRAELDADFNEQALRTNAVLRWEYRPGSTLFIVWSQGRSQSLEDGSFALRRDVGRLLGRDAEFPAPATNVLLMKVSYWLDR